MVGNPLCRGAFAVVSVGLDSPFGHPGAAVVERWRAAGAQVLQTGRHDQLCISLNALCKLPNNMSPLASA